MSCTTISLPFGYDRAEEYSQDLPVFVPEEFAWENG